MPAPPAPPPPRAPPQDTPTPPGWDAHLNLHLDHDPAHNRTVLRSKHGHGPLIVQKPLYPEHPAVCHIYLLHPPGGLVGGDTLRLTLTTEPAAHALLTTPGATKFYRTLGPPAAQHHHLSIADRATIEWLPQDTILYSGSTAHTTTTVHLAATSRFIGWELTCLGRPASADHYRDATYDSRFELWRARTPLLLERHRYASGHASMHAPWGIAGATVIATLYALPATPLTLQHLRDHLPSPTTGTTPRLATTLLDDVLVLRCTALDAEQCRTILLRAWHILRPLILHRPAHPPRIWYT